MAQAEYWYKASLVRLMGPGAVVGPDVNGGAAGSGGMDGLGGEGELIQLLHVRLC